MITENPASRGTETGSPAGGTLPHTDRERVTFLKEVAEEVEKAKAGSTRKQRRSARAGARAKRRGAGAVEQAQLPTHDLCDSAMSAPSPPNLASM